MPTPPGAETRARYAMINPNTTPLRRGGGRNRPSPGDVKKRSGKPHDKNGVEASRGFLVAGTG